MKFGIILVIILFASTTWAAPRLVWDSVSNADGYIVYFGLVDDSGYPNTCQVTETTCPLSKLNLSPGNTYKFVVTAWNVAGESGYSNEVTWDEKRFLPPTDNLPAIIITIPANPGGVTINVE